MTSALAPVSPALPAVAPTAGAGSPRADGAAPGAFSQQLAQHRAAEPAADGARASAVSAAAGSSSDEPSATGDDTSQSTGLDELLTELQGSDTLPVPSPTSTAAEARTASPMVEADPDAARAAATTEGTALPGAAPAAEPAGEAGTAAAQTHLLAGQAAGSVLPDKASAATPDSAAASTAAEGTAALQAQAPGAQAEAPAWSPVAAVVPGAAGAQPTPGMPAAAAAAPLPEARLPAPPGHADFAPQLGAQISVFVRQGLQQARLQLNPAEMGPITVQIRLDGGNAQVHLAAEHAATRQALEQAMPILAGSLRESGLTLTGGGVFEQPRQTGSDSQDPGRTGLRPGTGSGGHGDSADSGLALPTAPMAAARRGVVDLVA